MGSEEDDNNEVITTSEELIPEYIIYLLSINDINKALSVLEKYCINIYPNSYTLWIQYASLAYKIQTTKQLSSCMNNNITSRTILKKALSIIPIYNPNRLLLSIILFNHLLS